MFVQLPFASAKPPLNLRSCSLSVPRSLQKFPQCKQRAPQTGEMILYGFHCSQPASFYTTLIIISQRVVDPLLPCRSELCIATAEPQSKRSLKARRPAEAATARRAFIHKSYAGSLAGWVGGWVSVGGRRLRFERKTHIGRQIPKTGSQTYVDRL